MKRREFLFAAGTLATGGFVHAAEHRFPVLAQAAPQPRSPDVIFVPTPNEVVTKMLEMARVTAKDIVYDLGCGDGRIVITAAQKHGARGVGIDIDPQRIREARENASRGKVTDKVRFVEADLFEADISEATVVTLYLLTDLNLKLRPKLMSDLRPGTRVVSHAFAMGDWQPERTERVDGSSVFLWRIPPRPASNAPSQR
jgi:SAM-dependent methyltransferase